MRQLISLLILTLLITSSYGFWSEKIDVQIIDSLGRPIKGATVTVVYQSFNCVTHYDIVKQTDDSGTAHFEFSNTIPETAVTQNTTCVERTYKILSNYVGFSNETIGEVDGIDKNYQIKFPVVSHALNVRDAYGFPLTPSRAEFLNLTFEADSNGRIFLPLPIGRNVNIDVIFRNLTQTIQRKENQDSVSTVDFAVYDLKVKLFDERGNRIEGTVIVDDVIQKAEVDKPALFERFAYEKANFKIAIDGIRKIIESEITGDALDIHVDLSPPSIRDLSVSVTNSKDLELSATIVEEGEFASGLLANPIVRYNSGEGWQETKMFPTSALGYEATIPSKGNNTEYRISAEDVQGNIGVHKGNYTFKEVIKPGKPTEPDKNRTTDIANASIDATKDQIDQEPQVVELSLTHILGAIIFVVIVIFIYQRIRERI